MANNSYQLPDQALTSYDHAIAELWSHNEMRAYLACVVHRFGFGAGEGPWPWFVVVWPDGKKEPPIEDYGPDWCVVRELESGFFTFGARPSTVSRHRFFGVIVKECEEQIEYRIKWLDRGAAEKKWSELGLTLSDF